MKSRGNNKIGSNAEVDKTVKGGQEEGGVEAVKTVKGNLQYLTLKKR